ncbi:MAG: methyltransferase domain-containing protein, partial [Bdellovibrionota bacterium]
DLAFFDEAIRMLRNGFDLVTGNRRSLDSLFDVPVAYLPLAYRRHRLGIRFNWISRLLLGFKTRDTQAGIKAMSRQLAHAAFSNQTCPGFFFDLELFLTASRSGFKTMDLPVLLYLNTEKSTVRVLRESLLAAFWLSRITIQAWSGFYGKRQNLRVLTGFLSRYGNSSFLNRVFLFLRWRLTPYLDIISEIPKEGRILDIGTGHGLLPIATSLLSPQCELLGIDHDPSRIAQAKQASLDLTQVRFTHGDLSQLPVDSFSAITLIDVMHYLSPDEQEALTQRAFKLLLPGGRFIVREVNQKPGAVSACNQIYEKLATALGFTRSANQSLFFRSESEWTSFFRSAGFDVSSRPCS